MSYLNEVNKKISGFECLISKSYSFAHIFNLILAETKTILLCLSVIFQLGLEP